MKYNPHDILKISFIENALISDISTYKTGGNIKGLFLPKNEKELLSVWQFLNEFNLPFKIIGNGSNLLISPLTNLLFVSTKNIKPRFNIKGNIATLSTSTSLAKAFSICLKHGLGGFERIAGIPASLGGAIKNNASAFGQSIFDHLESLRVFQNGTIKIIKKKDIIYSYHSTNIEGLILSAKFKLPQEKQCNIIQDFIYCTKRRADCQPKGFSCGSVFKNPPQKSAGKLIEECGLKGRELNGAKISEKHGNFIINRGNASFENVLSLIQLCETEVEKKFQIKLEREVEIIK